MIRPGMNTAAACVSVGIALALGAGGVASAMADAAHGDAGYRVGETAHDPTAG